MPPASPVWSNGITQWTFVPYHPASNDMAEKQYKLWSRDCRRWRIKQLRHSPVSFFVSLPSHPSEHHQWRCWWAFGPRLPWIHSLPRCRVYTLRTQQEGQKGTYDCGKQEHACKVVHSERRGGIATAPPLRRSYSDGAVTSPGGAFQTDTNLANHRHLTRLLADCQWRCQWRCGLGRLRNTRSLTKTIPRDRRKLIKLMLRKWTFLPPCSHLICQFVKRHLVTLRREQHVLAQWLRQYFCQDHGVHSVVR